MKIRKARADRRKRRFEIETFSGASFVFPYAKAAPIPSVQDPVARTYPDPELAKEAFTYVLASGAEGTVLMDHILEYNEDPATIRQLLVHRLSVAARSRLEVSPLAVREVARRLGTSPAQVYRLVDPSNQRTSIDALVQLLSVLDCDVDVVVRSRAA